MSKLADVISGKIQSSAQAAGTVRDAGGVVPYTKRAGDIMAGLAPPPLSLPRLTINNEQLTMNNAGNGHGGSGDSYKLQDTSYKKDVPIVTGNSEIATVSGRAPANHPAAAFHAVTPEIKESNRRLSEEWENSPYSKMGPLDAALTFAEMKKKDRDALPENIRARLEMMYLDETKRNDDYFKISGNSGRTADAFASSFAGSYTLGLSNLAAKARDEEYAKRQKLARLQSPIASAVGGVLGAMSPASAPGLISKGIAKAAGPLVQKAATPLTKALANITTGGGGVLNRAGVSEIAKHPVRTALASAAHEAALRGVTSAAAGGVIGAAEEAIAGNPEEILKTARERAVSYGVFGAAGGALSGAYKGLAANHLAKQIVNRINAGEEWGRYMDQTLLNEAGGISVVAEEVAGLILRPDRALSGASAAAKEVLKSPHVLDAVARAGRTVNNEQLTINNQDDHPAAVRHPSMEGNGSAGDSYKLQDTSYKKEVPLVTSNSELVTVSGAPENHPAALRHPSAEGNGSARYSLNQGFGAAYDNWVNNYPDSNISLYVGNTSDALQAAGVRESRITWDTGKILNIKEKHPGMTDEVIKQVPRLIEEPILIMESLTRNDRLTMLGEVYDNSGFPVMTVLELRPTKNGVEIDGIKIASAYARQEQGGPSADQYLLDNSNIRYIDGDTERVNAWLSGNRLQLPFPATRDRNLAGGSWLSPFAVTSETKPANVPADHSIPQGAAAVNGDSYKLQDTSYKKDVGRDKADNRVQITDNSGDVGRDALGGQRNIKGVNENVGTTGQSPNIVSDGGGQRDVSADTGGRPGILAERPAGSQERNAQAGRARDLQRKVHDLQLEPTSARALGIANGTDAAVNTVIPEHLHDDAIRAAAARIKARTGIGAVFVTGPLQIDAGGEPIMTKGAITPRGVFIQADHRRYTVDQIADHEIFHDMAAFNQELVPALREKITERFTPEEYDAILQKYYEAYAGLYSADLDAMALYMAEEIFADAYAGINAFGASQLTDNNEQLTVKQYVDAHLTDNNQDVGRDKADNRLQITDNSEDVGRDALGAPDDHPAALRHPSMEGNGGAGDSYKLQDTSYKKDVGRDKADNRLQITDNSEDVGRDALGAPEWVSLPKPGDNIRYSVDGGERRDAGGVVPYKESAADIIAPTDFRTADVPSRKEMAANQRDKERLFKKKLLDTFFAQPGDRARLREELDILAARLNSGLYTEETLENVFTKLFDAGKVQTERGEDYTEAARFLRGQKIYVSPADRAEFGDDWNRARKRAFGHKVYFTGNSGDLALDVSNMELAGKFPGFFNARDADPTVIINNMFRVLDAAKPEMISLDEQARRYGGEEAAAALRAQMYQDFLDDVSEHHNSLRGARAARTSAIEEARAENSARLREYGRTVKKHIESMAARTRNERLRIIPKDEFAGTLAAGDFDIKIEGALGNYSLAPSIIENRKAARELQKGIRRAERLLRPSLAEKEFARGISAGRNSPDGIPASMDADKVMELADYYWAERGFSNDALRRQRADINWVLDEQMEELFSDSDEFRPRGAVSLNYNTPERNIYKIFGEERGGEINKAIFWPVGKNAAERYRFMNAMFDKMRRIEDGTGKLRKLTEEESAFVMLTIEGKAAEELAAGMQMHEAIRRAAENIKIDAEIKYGAKAVYQTEKDAGYRNIVNDAANEFSLGAEERRAAARYARWLQTQGMIESGAVDGVIIDNAAKMYKERFDEFHDLINKVLVTHGYEPIGYIKGYAPHMQEPETKKLWKNAFEHFGFSTDVTKLPTSIAGMTASYKPLKKWNPYFLERHGEDTKYDIVSAYESYVYHLSPVIYHTDDIMRVRAAERFLRRTYAPSEIQNNLEWARELRYGTDDEKQEFLRSVRAIAPDTVLAPADIDAELERFVTEQYERIGNKSKFGEFAAWLNNYANILAGKQSSADRGAEAHWGREGLTGGNKFVRTFARAQVAGNLVSTVSQISQWTDIISVAGKRHAAAAFADIFSGKLRKHGWARESDFLTGKHGLDYINLTPMQKVDMVLYKPLQVFDSLTAALAVRSWYNRERAAGKSHSEAMEAADHFGRRAMGSRMTGEKPVAFHAKNAPLQMLHMFQIEAANAISFKFQDLPRYFNRMAREKGRDNAWREWTKYIANALLIGFIINRLTEEGTGSKQQPLDILGIIANTFAAGNEITANELLRVLIDNGAEQIFGERPLGSEPLNDGPFNWGAAAGAFGRDAVYQVPYARNAAGLLGIGNNSLPMPDLYGAGKNIMSAANDSGVLSPEMARAALGLASDVLPGGRQLNKTAQGLETALRGGRYSGYGDDSRLQHPIEGGFWDVVRAALFGNSGLDASRDFWASGLSSLTKKQTALYESLVDGGADRMEMYDAIQEWRRIGSEAGALPGDDGEPDPTGKQRRDLIRGLELTDAQKLELYQGLTGADTRSEKFGALMSAGLGWDDVMDAYDKYEELRVNGAMNASARANALARWADMQGFTKDQAAAVKDQLKFFSSIPAEAARYESLISAGLTAEQAYDLTNDFTGLGTDMQRYRAIDAARLSDAEKLAAIGSVMGTEMETAAGNPSQYAKLLAVIDTGLSVREYLDLRESGDVDKYLNYVDAGMSPTAALGVTEAMTEAEADAGDEWGRLQQYRAAVDAVTTPEEQLAALTVLMPESEYLKVETASRYLIQPKQYVRMRELLAVIDLNGTVTQDEARQAVDMMLGLNNTQKAVLWQMQNKSWAARNNPYNTSVGAEVREALNSSGGELAPLTLPALPSLSDR